MHPLQVIRSCLGCRLCWLLSPQSWGPRTCGHFWCFFQDVFIFQALFGMINKQKCQIDQTVQLVSYKPPATGSRYLTVGFQWFPLCQAPPRSGRATRIHYNYDFDPGVLNRNGNVWSFLFVCQFAMAMACSGTLETSKYETSKNALATPGDSNLLFPMVKKKRKHFLGWLFFYVFLLFQVSKTKSKIVFFPTVLDVGSRSPLSEQEKNKVTCSKLKDMSILHALNSSDSSQIY